MESMLTRIKWAKSKVCDNVQKYKHFSMTRLNPDQVSQTGHSVQ